MNSLESLQEAVKKAKEKYEDECLKANLDEKQVNDILKRRMALIQELNNMQAITNTLLTKYAYIKNCSLRQALEEFNIPTDQ